MKKKFIIPIMILILVIGVVGGTLAWLTDQTAKVTNTFTVGDVDITLTETPNTDKDGDGNADVWEAKLMPGTEYAKNPVVSVVDNSEDCWLFVKFEEVNSPATVLTYTSTLKAPDWTQGDGTNIPDNVWYRQVKKADTTREWHLLADNKVTVKDEVGGTIDMPTASQAPLLEYTAYAVQLKNNSTEFSAAEAWDKL